MRAPESKPKKLLSRSLKLPAPSDRVNRCVTRKAILCSGSLSVVGSAARLKSGCSGSSRLSGSEVCAGVGAGGGGGGVVGSCASAFNGLPARARATSQLPQTTFVRIFIDGPLSQSGGPPGGPPNV